MSISSSLNAGVSGLNVNASKLAAISDNIANSRTYGYKRADVDFYSLALTQREGAYTAGGARAQAYRVVEGQGSLVSTTNSTDISVAGRGMLPVTLESALDNTATSLPLQLLSTGSFRPDAQGYLKTTSGQVLMGWPALADGTIPTQPRDSANGLEPVVISFNQFASEPTTEITFRANLPAAETLPGATGAVISRSVNYFDPVGAPQTLDFNFTPTVPGVSPASNTWSLDIVDQAQGASIGTYDIVFNDGTGVAVGGSVQSITPTGAGTYDPVTGAATVAVAGGNIDIFLGIPDSTNVLTQLSDVFTTTGVVSNGNGVGSLRAIEIDDNGLIKAAYEGGFTRTIFQVPLVDVPNLNGLTAEDNQAFTISAESGPLFLWDAGDGPTGSVIGYAREESTTDIAAELTQLIQTQRAYSSNARVIQTVDEMLQETTNIIR